MDTIYYEDSIVGDKLRVEITILQAEVERLEAELTVSEEDCKEARKLATDFWFDCEVKFERDRLARVHPWLEDE